MNKLTEEAAVIAGKLTKAQRAYMSGKTVWQQPALGHNCRWMTFPPSNVHRVLMRENLVDGVGQIRALGLAVREILLASETGRG